MTTPGKQAIHPTQLLRKQAGRKRRARMEDYRKKSKRNAIAVFVNAQKNKTKSNGEVIITGEKTQHPRGRRKIREKLLASGNSATVNALFNIDTEWYLDKPLIFDLKSTGEEKIFDWLLSNILPDNDTYYIEHEDGSNVFRIKKEK